ncbi:MAG: right-handed parallel beta-helix repeat-containing protein [Methanobrevibacter arboriphilus]|nr:right-handed parallel beta-helix repeat-containing protein [Methanobrevibacter arboriphilus]
MSSVNAASYSVDSSNSNGSGGDGSIDNPYDNIGLAVNKTNSDYSFGDTIIIGGGKYKASGNNTNLTISRNVSIYGAKYYYKDNNISDTVIDGEGLSRIFNINSGITVNIYGIVFVNGKSTTTSITTSITNGSITYFYWGEGGAIYSKGDLNIYSCYFKDNSADYGGALASQGNLKIFNSIFVNNFASSSGGAIFKEFGEVDLIDSNITNNSAFDGAALYIWQGHKFFISNSIFTYNKGNLSVISHHSPFGVPSGLSISIYEYNLTINNSSFTGNLLSSDGYMVYAKGFSYLNILKSNFIGENNKFGGIYCSFISYLKFNNILDFKNAIFGGYSSNIENNNIFNSNYGIYNVATDVSIKSNFISNCIYGVYNRGNRTIISFNTFYPIDGYAVYNDGSYVIIENNKVDVSIIGNDGAYYLYNNYKYGIYNKGFKTTINSNNVTGYGEYGVFNTGYSGIIKGNNIRSTYISTLPGIGIIGGGSTYRYFYYGIYNEGKSVLISENRVESTTGIYNKGSYFNLSDNYLDSFNAIFNSGNSGLIANNYITTSYVLKHRYTPPVQAIVDVPYFAMPDFYSYYHLSKYHIKNKGNNVTIQYNNITSSNKCGIVNTGDSIYIKNNYIFQCEYAIYNNGKSSITYNNLIESKYGIYNKYKSLISFNSLLSCNYAIYNTGDETNIKYNNLVNNNNGIFNKANLTKIHKNKIVSKSLGLNSKKNSKTYGILIKGKNNEVFKNNISFNGDILSYHYAIFVKGDSNKIFHNKLTNMFYKGVVIFGNNNFIFKNIIYGAKVDRYPIYYTNDEMYLFNYYSTLFGIENRTLFKEFIIFSAIQVKGNKNMLVSNKISNFNNYGILINGKKNKVSNNKVSTYNKNNMHLISNFTKLEKDFIKFFKSTYRVKIRVGKGFNYKTKEASKSGIHILGIGNIIINNQLNGKNKGHMAIKISYYSNAGKKDISKYNKLIRNKIAEFKHGITVTGIKNMLFSNILTKNKKFGVQILGSKNTVKKCIITKNGDHGVKIIGNKNIITRNTIKLNKHHQIKLLGYANKITKNNFGVKKNKVLHIVYSRNSFNKNK